MENEKGIVKTSEVKLPKFVEDAYNSIEGMKQFANMLLESKLVPDSYYEKTPDNKPDYTKGKTSAVVVVLLQAQQLAVPPMTALQHIVPVNGLLSIKGDLAKTMIFSSGKLRKDSWKEIVTGTIEEENMVVTITATRDDNGLTLTRSFSVEKAKRMGLWITSTQVNSADGWKWKKSAWYKTPDRMVMYRCIGFIARDLFSDVLLNMYTTEEAVDIIQDATEIIQTPSGATITIPDKSHAKQRAGKLTERVVARIPENKFGEIPEENPNKKEAERELTENEKESLLGLAKKIDEGLFQPKDKSPFVPDKGSVEYLDGKEIKRDGKDDPGEETPAEEGSLTLVQMEEMDTKVLLGMVTADMDMMEAMELIPGKNTNKKLREIIFAHQQGKLVEFVAPHLSKITEENAGTNIQPNKEFDKQKESKEIDDFLNAPSKKPVEQQFNKYAMDVPSFDKGMEREFGTYKKLYNQLLNLTPPIDNKRYLDLAVKLGILTKYPDREQFCRLSTVEEINLLLNTN